MKTLVVLAMIFGCAGAFAQGVNSQTTIKSIQAGQNITNGVGPVLVSLPNNNTNSASCVTSGYQNYFAIDPTTTYGKALLTTIRKIWAMGGTITLTGANTCNIYSGVEDLATVVPLSHVVVNGQTTQPSHH